MSKLLVYLHLVMKQRALQSALEGALRGVEVTAVGRIADFDRALAAGQDAVLSLPVVLAARGLTSKLQGTYKGSIDETYVLGAVDQAVSAASVKSIGVLDLLGRSETNDFVFQLVESRPKVERVTKVEDLLPLLQMQRVECICLPERLFQELRGMSRMNLVRTELRKRVGLPSVGSVAGRGSDIVAAVRSMSGDVSKSMGVDAWR
jgi:hypothetical protein